MKMTRFAPSPTGLLHVGHAASAWFTWDHAERDPAQFILRLEDIDTTRCRPEYVQAILEDLQWLGISWTQPVRKQSEHFAEYQETLHKLDAMGVTYPCFCTRKEIEEEIARAPSAPHGPDGFLYPGTCRSLSASEQADKIAHGLPYAIRLDLSRALARTGALRWHDLEAGWQEAQPEMLGDAVLARKDTPVSYHLCVTHDDALQEISLVTRGADLFHATHLHRVLQALLGLPTPQYCHHPLLTGPDGKKFSKRNKDLTLCAVREKGFSAVELQRMLRSNAIEKLI